MRLAIAANGRSRARSSAASRRTRNAKMPINAASKADADSGETRHEAGDDEDHDRRRAGNHAVLIRRPDSAVCLRYFSLVFATRRRQSRCGRLLVPVDRFQIIAHKLLIVGGCGPPGL